MKENSFTPEKFHLERSIQLAKWLRARQSSLDHFPYIKNLKNQFYSQSQIHGTGTEIQRNWDTSAEPGLLLIISL